MNKAFIQESGMKAQSNMEKNLRGQPEAIGIVEDACGYQTTMKKKQNCHLCPDPPLNTVVSQRKVRPKKPRQVKAWI